jgi:hypothetical protein
MSAAAFVNLGMVCLRIVTFSILLLFSTTLIIAQSISTTIPKTFNTTDKFLFYLHGGVVTVLGDNAINQSVPEWGPYEYSKILDSLKMRGFHVISEIRKEGVEDSIYANKIVKQLDTLRQHNVKIKNIILVGASAGSNIVLLVAVKMKNRTLKCVVMGGCWPDTYKQYLPLTLYGKFLSVIELTDPHGTCLKLFEGRKTISKYNEITLNTGLSHGFICKGYKEWVDPVVQWSDSQ